MVRISNIEQSLDFYCNKVGMQEVRRVESEAGRYTLVFLAAPADKGKAAADRAPLLELTFNWDPETYGEGRNFGHLAFEVDDIYATCDRLMKAGVTINRPRVTDAWLSFVRPTTSRSSCCKRARRRPRKSRGPRCPTPASGEAAVRRDSPILRSPTNFLKMHSVGDRLLSPFRIACVAGRCARAGGRDAARGVKHALLLLSLG